MYDKIKKPLLYIAIIPALITGWSTIVATVVYIDVAFEIIEVAAKEDEQGRNGLDIYGIRMK